MTVMAVIEEQHTLTAYEKKKYFREKLLEHIRQRIGVNNADQQIKELLLPYICSKITAIHIGCLDKIGQEFKKEIWHGHFSSDEYHQLPREAKNIIRQRPLAWNECRLFVKQLANDIMDDVIDILNQVIFEVKDGTEVEERLKHKQRKEDYERSRNEKRNDE